MIKHKTFLQIKRKRLKEEYKPVLALILAATEYPELSDAVRDCKKFYRLHTYVKRCTCDK